MSAMLAHFAYVVTLVLVNELLLLCKVLLRCLPSLRKRSTYRDSHRVDLEGDAILFIDRVCSDTIKSRRFGDPSTTSPAVDRTIARLATFKISDLFGPASVSRMKHAYVAKFALTLFAWLETVLSPLESSPIRRLNERGEKQRDKSTAAGLCKLQETHLRWIKAFAARKQCEKAKDLLMTAGFEANSPCKPPCPSQIIDQEILREDLHPNQRHLQREDRIRGPSPSDDMSEKPVPLETIYQSLIHRMRYNKTVLNLSRQNYSKLQFRHHKAKLVFCTGRFDNWLKQECRVEGMMHEVSKEMRWYRREERGLVEEVWTHRPLLGALLYADYII